ncbi:MAG: radical SAM protein [Candidatus Altiarchaeota archaeon]
MELGKSRSLCPICLKEIDASIIQDDGRVFISRECAAHGLFVDPHLYEDPVIYKALSNMDCGGDDVLPDTLVFHTTPACNMDCQFCPIPGEMRSGEGPEIGEIMDEVSRFHGSTIFLCGGEPTIRGDLPEIVGKISGAGKNVLVFTNGLRLADRKNVDSLKATGLTQVILSFSTFQEEKDIKVYGSRVTSLKLKALENLKATLTPTGFSFLVFKDINEDEVDKVIGYAVDNREWVKSICFQVVWRPSERDSSMVKQKGIIDLVRKSAGIDVEDFIECTVFGSTVSEIFRRITGRGGRVYSRCELRCQSWVSDGRLVPLSGMIDLKTVNESLRRINSRLKGSAARKIGVMILFFPYTELLKSFIFNRDFRNFCLSRFSGMLSGIVHGRMFRESLGKDMLGFMVGRYYTRYNIDLGLADTCRYCRSPEGNDISYCICDMIGWTENKQTA